MPFDNNFYYPHYDPRVRVSSFADNQDVDLIVGKMLRQLLPFDGQQLNDKTVLAMQSIVEQSVYDISRLGGNGDYVRGVADKLSFNGRPISYWLSYLGVDIRRVYNSPIQESPEDTYCLKCDKECPCECK